MAQFTADVLLDVVSQRAERALKRVERSVDRIDKKAGDIDVQFDIDTAAIRRAERELQKLEKRRNAAFGVSGTGGSGGGGGGGAGIFASLLPAAAVASAAVKDTRASTQSLNAALK